MSIQLRLDDVRRAWEARDPELVELVVALASQEDERPDGAPVREGAPTFAKYLEEIQSAAFRRRPLEEQAHRRQELMRAVEAPTAEVPPPERLGLWEVVEALWDDGGPFARTCLLEIIDRVPLVYGPWRALKRIFKAAEARDDVEVLAALSARIDQAGAALGVGAPSEITRRTIDYLRRRAWRYLRRTAQTCPALYADIAAEFLARYDDRRGGLWIQTWVAAHICFHETGKYDRSRFHLPYSTTDLLKDRAFPDLWRRSPRPLFGLLERARSDQARRFAAEALKADFRASLREVEPAWVARLVGVQSEAVDELVVWILTNVPRFEQASFRALELHEAVLRLFDSPSREARRFAAEYARTHARDLPVDDLVRLADNHEPAVRKLAGDLLRERDPRKEIGLDAWGRLLETEHGHPIAADALRKHFGAKELTPEWFRGRLLSRSEHAFEFARALLPQVHPFAKLGPDYFRELIEATDEMRGEERYSVDDYFVADRVVEFALEVLAKFDRDALDPDFLRRSLLRPLSRDEIADWIDEGRLQARTLGLDFLKAVAYHPAFESDPWIGALKRSGRPWAKNLTFNEELADRVLEWLRDVRRFTPAELGFDWLLTLVRRSEPRYHDFAVETMIKGFVPADFAPPAEAATSPTPSAAAPVAVDFGGASFLFTGKLATMQRKEAEKKVRDAGGAVASGVTNKLHTLVIGDEGSPLYGHGKKGSKQLKAEELNAAGANIRIISETAFLKLLTGAAQEVSLDATLAGSERLWRMATAAGPADAPLSRFAIKYIRRHHPDIALEETDRPVDPGAEIPAEFLSFERVEPLFFETRKPLRDLALELARWEFARWSPPADDLVRLAESPHSDVRQFVARALLAEDAPEHRRYRIDPESLPPEAVYRFCESADDSTRALGMELIRRSPRLRVPEELFRLTESPDRRMRGFVIRELWALYRDRGITDGWTPYIPPAPKVGAGARKTALVLAEARGTGPPARPEQLPAPPRDLWHFLRRGLFELPPARPEKGDADAVARLRPLPARKAKLALVETMRDLALEDADFARGALPLLDEFLATRGRSEQAACLVAVTRIRHVHPALRREGEGAAS